MSKIVTLFSCPEFNVWAMSLQGAVNVEYGLPGGDSISFVVAGQNAIAIRRACEIVALPGDDDDDDLNAMDNLESAIERACGASIARERDAYRAAEHAAELAYQSGGLA